MIDVRLRDGGRGDPRAGGRRPSPTAVAELHGRGYPYRDIAVLFRALTMVEPYRAALAARGIPAHLVAGRGFFTHEQVADTMALLALVENPFNEEALIRVLASPYVGGRGRGPARAARGGGRGAEAGGVAGDGGAVARRHRAGRDAAARRR